MRSGQNRLRQDCGQEYEIAPAACFIPCIAYATCLWRCRNRFLVVRQLRQDKQISLRRLLYGTRDMTNTSLTFDVKTADRLIWQGQVVMSRSEAPYFDELFERVAQVVRPQRVLEIGFGLGISADLIQRRLQPTEHHIVEIDTGIYADLVRFTGDHRGVVACLGDWRSAPLAAPFDLVFYDPFNYTEELDDPVREAGLLRRLVRNGGALCHPHFGDGPPRVLPGFRTVVLKRFKVPEIDMADGTHCGHAAAVLCYPDD